MWGLLLQTHCVLQLYQIEHTLPPLISVISPRHHWTLPSNAEPARCMYLVPLAYGVTISSPLFAMEGAAMGVGAARTPEACITLGATIETRCFQPSHMQRSVDL